MVKAIPYGDRIILQVIAEDDKTAGGIIIPDASKEKPSKATVVAVGKGITNDKGERITLDVKVGDTVLYGKWAGTEINLEGEDYIVVKESDLIAVLETA